MSKFTNYFDGIAPHTDNEKFAAAVKCNLRPKRKSRRTFIAIASAAAAAAVLTVTVSAVKFGWVEQLFGESAELITENIDKYKVEIGNVKIENAEGVPYSFTMGDVISDGSSLYINLFIGGLEIESKYDFAFSADTADTDGYRDEPTQTVNGLLDASGSAFVIFSPESGVEKNDKIEFTLTDCTGQKAPPEPLADVSFEILSDITDMTKRIEVNQTAEFVNSYDSEPRTEKLFIETVEISPLRYVIKGIGNYGSYISPGNIYLILKNGEKIPFDPSAGYLSNDGSENYDVMIEKHYDTVDTVLDLDAVEAIEIGSVTVDI